ncbi:MAG: hypothetical protein K0Q43_125 [Ramlibacter sp.]|nr:hypothetical protein [Ramlibacter sp.]
MQSWSRSSSSKPHRAPGCEVATAKGHLLNDESNDRLLIDNLMTAALAGDSAQVDAARIALRRRFMALRSACATGLQPPAEEQIEAAWVAFNRTRTQVGEGTPEFLRRCVAEAVSAAWSAQTRHSEQNRPKLFVANMIVAQQWGVDAMTPFVRLMDKPSWDAQVAQARFQRQEQPEEPGQTDQAPRGG